MKSFEYYLAQQERVAQEDRRKYARRRLTREEKRLERRVAAVMAVTATIFVILAAMALMATLSGCAKGSTTPEQGKPSEAVSVATVVLDSEMVTEVAPASAPVEPTAEPTPEPTPAVFIYDVPLDADLQLHIIQFCDSYHIDPAIIMAMIQRESRFKAEVVGDGGESFGLMQIKAKYHRDRMEKLGVTDLLDPYQNVMVGIDFLGELLLRHEDIELALMSYNAGESGANYYWWSRGIYTNAYSSGVLEQSRTLREGMVEHG